MRFQKFVADFIVSTLGWLAFTYAVVNTAWAIWRVTAGDCFLGFGPELIRGMYIAVAFHFWWRLKNES